MSKSDWENFRNCPVCDFEWHVKDSLTCPLCTRIKKKQGGNFPTVFSRGMFGTGENKKRMNLVYQAIAIILFVLFLYSVIGAGIKV